MDQAFKSRDWCYVLKHRGTEMQFCSKLCVMTWLKMPAGEMSMKPYKPTGDEEERMSQ
jgi:hypothetical protein